MDDEQMADFYDKKYGGRNRVQSFKGGAEDVPQQLLLPSVNDPNLWMIKCKVWILLSLFFIFYYISEANDIHHNSAWKRKRYYIQLDETVFRSSI